jgi:predicted PurR-regulated permease PerM
MAFLSLLPVVGSWLVWAPAVVWLYASGETVRATVLLGICAGLVGTIDNILRPILMSGHGRMNALVMFVGVLGGVAAFGMIGIVLGPLVLGTAMTLLDAYVRQRRAA